MKNPDEIIQKQIEEGKAPEGLDGESYKVIFSALKKSPELKLPTNFAHRVAAMAPGQAKTFSWDKFFLIGGCISFFFALIYAITSIHPKFSVGVFSFISGYPGLIVFVVIFILLLNWIDKKWISKSTVM